MRRRRREGTERQQMDETLSSRKREGSKERERDEYMLFFQGNSWCCSIT